MKRFGYDQAFYIFKGEELKEAVQTKYLETNINTVVTSNERKEHRDGTSSGTEFLFKMTIKKFRFIFQKGERLYEIEIPMEGSTKNKFTSRILWMLAALFGGIFLILIFNFLAAGLTIGLKPKCLLIGVFTSGLFFSFSTFIFLKYSSNFWNFVAGLVFMIAIFSIESTCLMGILENCKPDPDQNRTAIVILAVAALPNLAWLIVLIFKFELILKLFYFYWVMLVLDLACTLTSSQFWAKNPSQKQRKWIYLFSALIGSLKCFVDQLFVYLVYAVFVYRSHGEYPDLVGGYMMKDFMIIGGVTFLAILIEIGLCLWRAKKNGDHERTEGKIVNGCVLDKDGIPRTKSLVKMKFDMKDSKDQEDLGGNDIQLGDDDDDRL